MALKETINLNAPDKTEKKSDVTLFPRGTWDYDDSDPPVWTYTPLGTVKNEVSTTVKTWVACSLSACMSAASTYSGTGSYAYEETVAVLHSYTFRITESEIVNTFEPVEEE